MEVVLMVFRRCSTKAKGGGVVLERTVRGPALAFTLIELLVAMGIAFTVLSTLAFGYIQAYRISDSTMLQGAAQRVAVERLEQVRTAEWEYYGSATTNQLQEFVRDTLVPLRVPSVSTNEIMARVITNVTSVNTDPALQRIDVVCLWTNLDGHLYSNAVSTLRAPD